MLKSERRIEFGARAPGERTFKICFALGHTEADLAHLMAAIDRPETSLPIIWQIYAPSVTTPEFSQSPRSSLPGRGKNGSSRTLRQVPDDMGAVC